MPTGSENGGSQMRDPQLLQKIPVVGAPFSRRLLTKTMNGDLAQNLDAGRTDANRRHHQILATDLDADAGSDSQPFLEVSCVHWTEAALSYQRMIWNGGFHSGPRNFTMADTVRRKSENCPLAMRSRAVARKVTIGLGTIDRRPMPGPPLEKGASCPILLMGVARRKSTMAEAMAGSIPMACMSAG